jgi:uncharacterized protein YciI
MQYFVIIAKDIANSLEKRLAARPAHLERIGTLHEQGRVLVAGPCPLSEDLTNTSAGFSGSVIIAAFEHLNDAKSWAEADPYVKAGVYENVEVKPYKLVIGSALEVALPTTS